MKKESKKQGRKHDMAKKMKDQGGLHGSIEGGHTDSKNYKPLKY